MLSKIIDFEQNFVQNRLKFFLSLPKCQKIRSQGRTLGPAQSGSQDGLKKNLTKNFDFWPLFDKIISKILFFI